MDKEGERREGPVAVQRPTAICPTNSPFLVSPQEESPAGFLEELLGKGL